jgi:lipopolysaccharide transport protein LptA
MQQRIDFAKMSRYLALLLCAISLTFISSFLLKGAAETDEPETFLPPQEEDSDNSTDEIDEEDTIEGTSDEFEQNEGEGWTILTGNVKINRPDGFLNANKVTIYEDVETNETTQTVAEGNVELRDGDTFATCEHAILDHITDMIELHDNVVVLQNEDRLEADFFTFNRRTGKRIGKGNIKFKVRVKEKKKSESDQKEEDNVDTSNP